MSYLQSFKHTARCVTKSFPSKRAIMQSTAALMTVSLMAMAGVANAAPHVPNPDTQNITNGTRTTYYNQDGTVYQTVDTTTDPVTHKTTTKTVTASSLDDNGNFTVSTTILVTCANQADELTYYSCTYDCSNNLLPTVEGTAQDTRCPTVAPLSPQQSYVNNIDLNYVHWADDFSVGATGAGCSSCGGGHAPSKVQPIGLRRKHRFRNEVTAGSFGIGGFAEVADKQVTFVQMNGGVQATIFDPTLNSPLILSDGINGEGNAPDGVFHDRVNGSVKEARLLDANGNLTASLASAKWLDVVAFKGQVTRFEVIVTGDNSQVNGGTTSGLLAQWALDESSGTAVTDRTGLGHAGTFSTGTPPVFVAGKSGQTGDYALSFDGTSQAVNLGNPADLNFQGQITMSAWIKPSNTSGWRTILGHGYTNSPNAQTSMEIYNNTLVVGAWPGNRPAAITLPSDASTRFVHVVATYDGTNWNVYMDGVKEGSIADATGARQVSSNWHIGSSSVQTDPRFFQGAIDDVRVYNRALTDAEVSGLTAGTEPDATGLLARWDLNEGQGVTTADTTGNAAHAGALQPTQPIRVAGRSGQSGDGAVHFDGTNWVTLGNPTDLNFSGQITTTAWVKLDAVPTGWGTILGHGYTNTQTAMEIYNNQMWFGSWPGANRPAVNLPADAVGRWMHVASEYDGNNWRTYVDGNLLSVAASSVGALQVNTDWRIGAGSHAGDLRQFAGAIDDVRIYNRALSDAEIYALGGAQKSYGGRLVSIKDSRGYGLDVTYKYNPATNTQDAAAVQVDPTLQWQLSTSKDAQGNTVTYAYAPSQVAGAWVVSQAAFSNGQSATYTYGDGMHLTQVNHSNGSVSTFAYAVDPNTQKTTVAINDTTSDRGHEKKTAYLTNQITVLGGNAQSAQVWNQSAMMARMIKNGAGETSYMNYSPASNNSMTIYEGGNRLKQQSAGWQEQFYKENATVTQGANNTVQLSGTGEPFYASHGNQSPDTVLRQHGTIPGQYKEDGTWTWTTFDSDSYPTRTDYTDGTFETWSYDAQKHVIAHADRAGRTESSTYDAQGNLTSRTVGAGADAGTTTYAYFPAGDPNQFLLKTETDPNGNATDYTYDANHHVLTKTLPADVAGGTRPVYQYEYDSAGRLSKSTDPVGRYAQYTYDSLDRVVRTDYCGVSYEQTVYGTGDDANRVIATRDRDGSWTQMRYDGTGRVVKTISGIANQTDATNLGFVPDPAFHTVTDNTYLAGTNLLSQSVRNGKTTLYLYDYRNRQVAQSVYTGKTDANGNPVVLTTTTTYLQNSVLCTTDPYGRSTYYGYRGSDYKRVRAVKEAFPGAVATALGGQPTAFSQIMGLPRVNTSNASYTVEDYTLDSSGLQLSMVDGRGLTTQATYDSRGRQATQTIASGTTVQAQTQTIYDANSNVVEERGTRWFDSADATGYQKARAQMTYSGRNLLLAKTESAGQAATRTTTFSYYLDGKQVTTVLPNGNVIGGNAAAQTTTQLTRPLCGWALGNIDQAGNGTLTDTTIGGDAIHTIQVKNLQSLTTTLANGYIVPNFLNEVSMDVPDASTISESTTRYDSKHRPIASTLWSGAIGAVYRNDVPVWFNGQVQGGTNAQAAVPAGVTGQTTLYYYSENLAAGATLTHPFGPALNIQPVLDKLAGQNLNLQGTLATGSASATLAPTGEVTVQIMDGAGRPVVSAKLDTSAP